MTDEFHDPRRAASRAAGADGEAWRALREASEQAVISAPEMVL